MLIMYARLRSYTKKNSTFATTNPTTLLVRKASAPGWDFVLYIPLYEIYQANDNHR